MFTLKRSLLQAVSVLALLGSVAVASPVLAAPQDGSAPAGPPNSTVELNQDGHVVATTPDTSESVTMSGTSTKAHHHMMKKDHVEEMKAHVEMRIKTLHDKLKITSEQETAWSGVADAMRENETTIGGLIHERHEHPKNLTAVDDLENYQKIAQAHADGLGKVVTAFKSLYNTLSDAQKKNADIVFGSFEGHHDHKKQ